MYSERFCIKMLQSAFVHVSQLAQLPTQAPIPAHKLANDLQNVSDIRKFNGKPERCKYTVMYKA